MFAKAMIIMKMELQTQVKEYQTHHLVESEDDCQSHDNHEDVGKYGEKIDASENQAVPFSLTGPENGLRRNDHTSLSV